MDDFSNFDFSNFWNKNKSKNKIKNDKQRYLSLVRSRKRKQIHRPFVDPYSLNFFVRFSQKPIFNNKHILNEKPTSFIKNRHLVLNLKNFKKFSRKILPRIRRDIKFFRFWKRNRWAKRSKRRIKRDEWGRFFLPKKKFYKNRFMQPLKRFNKLKKSITKGFNYNKFDSFWSMNRFPKKYEKLYPKNTTKLSPSFRLYDSSKSKRFLKTIFSKKYLNPTFFKKRLINHRRLLYDNLNNLTLSHRKYTPRTRVLNHELRPLKVKIFKKNFTGSLSEKKKHHFKLFN